MRIWALSMLRDGNHLHALIASLGEQFATPMRLRCLARVISSLSVRIQIVEIHVGTEEDRFLELITSWSLVF